MTGIDVLTGNLVWVDAVNGSDATDQRGRLRKPFRTLTAAKNAGQIGDTITVRLAFTTKRNCSRPA